MGSTIKLVTAMLPDSMLNENGLNGYKIITG